MKWLRTVNNYDVGAMAKTYREAMTTPEKGLKVIVAEGECQLERQRRLRPQVADRTVERRKRTVRVKYGVDEDTCTGDHSCIRLSGCPTLTVKDNPDPLRRDPVATVIDGCVGCGLCGENAHAAVLCPSFYRAEVIQNPSCSWTGCVHTNPYESSRATDHHPDCRARRRRRRRHGRLADGRCDAQRLSGAGDVDPGRRAAHRRDDLLS